MKNNPSPNKNVPLTFKVSCSMVQSAQGAFQFHFQNKFLIRTNQTEAPWMGMSNDESCVKLFFKYLPYQNIPFPSKQMITMLLENVYHRHRRILLLTSFRGSISCPYASKKIVGKREKPRR